MSAADVERLVAAATKAREFTHQLAPGKTVTVRLPTEHQLELATAAMQGGETGVLEYFRGLLEQCIVDWSGVVEADLVPGEPDEPAPAVPFNRALVPLLLDAKPAQAKELRAELIARLSQRAARAKAAQKN
ncbi:MAG: hypothetical protein ACK53W_10275 [Gemmatimonadota bacterium]